MFRQWFGQLLLAAGFLSCSAPAHRAEVPLTRETFQSSDGILQGFIPQGWFASTDPELTPHLLAWLVRDDYGATLSFQEIRVDPKTAQEIDKTGLALLAEISFRLKKAERPSAYLTAPPRMQSSGEKKSCRYEYIPEEGAARTAVIVFRADSRFFESSASSTRATETPEEYQQLLDVQEAVIASLQS